MTFSPMFEARFCLMFAVSIPIVIEDMRARRIPNWTCAALLVAGLAIGGVESGARGVLLSVAGAIAGLLAFLVFYMLGGMGGGDIKLMAACGSLLGLQSVPAAAILTAIVGAGIAISALIIGMATGERKQSIPYGPAIVAGVLMTLLSRTG